MAITPKSSIDEYIAQFALDVSLPLISEMVKFRLKEVKARDLRTTRIA